MEDNLSGFKDNTGICMYFLPYVYLRKIDIDNDITEL